MELRKHLQEALKGFRCQRPRDPLVVVRACIQSQMTSISHVGGYIHGRVAPTTSPARLTHLVYLQNSSLVFLIQTAIDLCLCLVSVLWASMSSNLSSLLSPPLYKDTTLLEIYHAISLGKGP